MSHISEKRETIVLESHVLSESETTELIAELNKNE